MGERNKSSDQGLFVRGWGQKRRCRAVFVVAATAVKAEGGGIAGA